MSKNVLKIDGRGLSNVERQIIPQFWRRDRKHPVTSMNQPPEAAVSQTDTLEPVHSALCKSPIKFYI